MKKEIEEIIRVNQAGEYSAKRIYEGQLSILTGNETIQHMAEQEEPHLEYFNQEMINRRIRPTLLQPVWHYVSFYLGAFSAKIGEANAMVVTEAVEEVIDKHYQSQILTLENLNIENHMVNKIKEFREDELSHIEIARNNMANDAIMQSLLKKIVKIGCGLAIKLSKKL